MNTTDRVRKFILTNYYVADAAGLSDEDSLLDGGIIDSTGVLELILFIEEEFNIKVEDDEVIPANLDSIAQITRFVDHKAVS